MDDHNATGFPPIARTDAKILILGSMPGQKSLAENQYYAHPRNAFWPIIFKLLHVTEELNYTERKRLLIEHHIALWDVVKCCSRKGSLDSNIDHATIEPNDFNTFFAKQKNINTVFFNGGEAEKLFRKYVRQDLIIPDLKTRRLPSTSPAYAAASMEQKFAEWETILLSL